MRDRGEPCAVCGSADLRPHLRVAGASGGEGLIPTTDHYGTALADIVRCGNCGHMQLERFPAEELLLEAYADAESLDYVDEEAGQRETARRMLERIERHAGPGNLLDLGCWVGFLLAEASERGWRPLGIEPSEFASAYARDRLGLDVRTAGLLDAPSDRRFDAVVMGDVLEHLPRAGEALDRVRELLEPRGVLALALPDASSRVARTMGARWWSVIPTHVHYFTRDSIHTLLARRGYQVLALGTAPKTFSVGYYLGRLGGYRRGVAETLVGASARAGLRDRLWTPDLRDRMLVIARPARPAPTNGAAAE